MNSGFARTARIQDTYRHMKAKKKRCKGGEAKIERGESGSKHETEKKEGEREREKGREGRAEERGENRRVEATAEV